MRAETWKGSIFGSSISKRAWDDYVESERLPPLLYKMKEVKPEVACMVADVKRCRRRALEFTPYKIPIFSPLDNIQARTEYKLGDLNFVTKKPTNVVSQLAYTGVGWQHRSLTEHLMHFGIIDWEDISFTFSACGHLPSGIFDEPLNKMTEAWQDESLAKKALTQ